MATQEVNEYEQERRRKRDALRDAGLDVYGRRTEDLTPLADVRAKAPSEPGSDGTETFGVQGRIVLKRDMGKLSFLTIRDDTGDLQVGLQKNRLDESGWQVRNALDLGDLIVARGPLGTTKTGEPTVWAESVTMAAKSLVVPPDKHHGLEDAELRYRQRYVDLWANPESMDVMKKRFAIIDRMRQYLRDRGFVEVETPMLQPLHGGAAARPFETHHNAYDIPLYLRIAPELYLKRLLVGGMPKVFEINRNFRNEGVSPRHNPEFTMLEAYEAYGNWETMAELVEDMICTVAMEVLGTTVITIGEKEVNLGKRPWRRVSMVDLVEEQCGWVFNKMRMNRLLAKRLEAGELTNFDVDNRSPRKSPRRRKSDEHIEQLVATAQLALDEIEENLGYGELTSEDADRRERLEDVVRKSMREKDRILDRQYNADKKYRGTGAGEDEPGNSLGKLSAAEQLTWVYEKLVEPNLSEPTFVTRVPSVVIPLARPCEDDPYFADVYELAIGGQEISPGYTELNDPDVQARLFRDQAVEDEGERQKVDYDFLHALKVGMPPAGGMGLGVDRLVMLLLGQASIRDVLAFPLMKVEKTGDRRQETDRPEAEA